MCIYIYTHLFQNFDRRKGSALEKVIIETAGQLSFNKSNPSHPAVDVRPDGLEFMGESRWMHMQRYAVVFDAAMFLQPDIMWRCM